MPDLKSIVSRIRARISIVDTIRRWRIQQRQCRALRLQTLQQSLGEVGFTPYIEVVIWKRRFYAVLAAFVFLLIGCLLGGAGGSL